MSVLEQARRAYARLKAQRNGHREAPGRLLPENAQCPPLDEIGPPLTPDHTRAESALCAVSPPASTIRQGAETPRSCAESALCAESPPSSPPYLRVRDPAGLESVAAALDSTALVGLDTETTGLDPRRNRVRLLSLACDTIDGGTFTYLVDCFAVDPRPLFPLLTERPLVAHNAAFDLGFLARMGFEPGPVACLMLMSQLLHAGDLSKRHGLQAVAERELGITLDKAEQKSDWSRHLTPGQLGYAAADVAHLGRLYGRLNERLEAAGLATVRDIEFRCLPAMVWLASSGAPFDVAGWRELAEAAGQEALELARHMDRLAPPLPEPDLLGGGWDWDSPRQVLHAFQALGHDLSDTSDETLAAVDHPLAGRLRDYRAASKHRSTYGLDWLQHVAPDGRVYAGWRQLGGVAGRTSCKAPNLQQIPRDPRYRRCFAAPPGRVLVKADFSQLQLRIAAKVADERRMLTAYARGEDLHTLTARQLTGKAEVTKADRQLAQAVNFGLLFGLGARGLRAYAKSNYGLDLTEAEAGRYRDAFFRAYPGLKGWHRRAGSSAAKECRTLAGRRRLLDEKTPYTHRLNTPVQGTEADGLKQALALLWDRRGEVPGAFPVLVVHDEIVVECDEGQAEAAAAWLRRAMLDGMAPLVDPVPVEVEVKVGRTWGGD